MAMHAAYDEQYENAGQYPAEDHEHEIECARICDALGALLELRPTSTHMVTLAVHADEMPAVFSWISRNDLGVLISRSDGIKSVQILRDGDDLKCLRQVATVMCIEDVNA